MLCQFMQLSCPQVWQWTMLLIGSLVLILYIFIYLFCFKCKICVFKTHVIEQHKTTSVMDISLGSAEPELGMCLCKHLASGFNLWPNHNQCSIALNRELKMYVKVFTVIFYHNTWNFWKLLFGVSLMSIFYSHSNEKNVNMRSVF